MPFAVRLGCSAAARYRIATASDINVCINGQSRRRCDHAHQSAKRCFVALDINGCKRHSEQVELIGACRVLYRAQLRRTR